MPFTIAFAPGVTLTRWTRAWEERRPDMPLMVLPVTEGRQLSVLGVDDDGRGESDRRGDGDVQHDGDRQGLGDRQRNGDGQGDGDGPGEHDGDRQGGSGSQAEGRADVSFVRLRDESPMDTTGLSVIRLYEESPVALLRKDDPLIPSEGSALTVADLADELIEPTDDSPDALKHAVELVAAGGGALVVPQAVARLHNRKDVVVVPVTDASPTQIALCWPSGSTSDDIDQFIGIVRGRTANSSRGAAAAPGKNGVTGVPGTKGATAVPGKKGATAVPGKRGDAGKRTREAGAKKAAGRRKRRPQGR